MTRDVMPDPMTPPVPAEAVVRLTAFVDTMHGPLGLFPRDESDERVYLYPADLRALLAAYADAARDREREVDALAEQLYWFDESHHGHEPAKAWENVGAVWQNGWRNRARTILSRLAAARTGEAR